MTLFYQGKQTLSIYGQRQLQVAGLLVYIDAIILGGEREAEKVNVLTFLQRSVILSF